MGYRTLLQGAQNTGYRALQRVQNTTGGKHTTMGTEHYMGYRTHHSALNTTGSFRGTEHATAGWGEERHYMHGTRRLGQIRYTTVHVLVAVITISPVPVFYCA